MFIKFKIFSDLNRLEKIKEIRKNNVGKKFHIVSYDWINECITKNQLVKEDSFHL